MPYGLYRVVSPILHPLPAAVGDVVGWYPARDVVVMRRRRGRIQIVRRLGFANDGALGVQICDGAMVPLSDADEALIRQRMPDLPWARSVASPPHTVAAPHQRQRSPG
jgi:hypothetical protein